MVSAIGLTRLKKWQNELYEGNPVCSNHSVIIRVPMQTKATNLNAMLQVLNFCTGSLLLQHSTNFTFTLSRHTAQLDLTWFQFFLRVSTSLGTTTAFCCASTTSLPSASLKCKLCVKRHKYQCRHKRHGFNCEKKESKFCNEVMIERNVKQKNVSNWNEEIASWCNG